MTFLREFLKADGFVYRAISSLRPLIAIIMAMIVSAGLISLVGANPLKAYAALLIGSVGSYKAISNTLVRASPLILSGLGVSLAVKVGLYNIGGEGQMYLGAIGATMAALLIPFPLPAWLHITISLLAGLLGGMIWGVVPALLRAYRGVSEVVTTMMLNTVAIAFTSWMVHYPQPLGEEGAFFPMSPMIPKSAQLPILLPNTSLHIGVFLGPILCVVMFFVLQFTTFGFRTRIVGANPEAARYAGASVRRQQLLILILGAGFSGLAGAIEIMGLKLRLYDMFVSGVGYEALALGLISGGNPLVVIVAGLFFGALKAGASKMQILTGVPTPMALVIEALCVLFVVGLGFAERSWQPSANKKEGEKKTVTKEERVNNGN